jgi:alginate O-acetyltransferase complex protein AlgI
MVFSTPIFLCLFLPLFAVAYTLLPRKNLILVVASLFFYAWGEPLFVLLMVAVAWVNYLFGRLVDWHSPYRSRYLALAVSINLGVLLVFKYLGFIVENLNYVINGFGLPSWPVPNLPLPLGISFFIFQAITYVVDVYRRHSPPARGFSDVLLYISLFPQLVAGPIVRYKEIAERIRSRHSDWQRVLSGAELFVIGLAKKVIIADSLSVPVDHIFTMPSAELGFGLAWFGAIGFALQIFFDFSGYSDMAIGIGRTLGFDFPDNFNQPYRSRSIQEFWRRWHMTLSRWFRDYVYIPLGGNRLGVARTYLNLLVVFMLTGLWHGASWNFLVWGLIHGMFLIFERIGLGKWLKSAWTPLAHFYTIGLVLVGWVFFRAENIPSAVAFLKVMIGFTQTPASAFLGDLANPYVLFVLLLGAVVAMLPEQIRQTGTVTPLRLPMLRYSALALSILFSLALIMSYSHKAFIYFRF